MSDAELAAAFENDKIIAKQLKAQGRHAHYSEIPAFEYDGESLCFPPGYDPDTPVPDYPHVWPVDNPIAVEEARVPCIPRPFPCKQLFVPLLFSGQRRCGDLQCHLETLLSQYAGCVWVLSIDIINDKILGNLMRTDVVARWTSLFAARAVLAMFAGPPCETFSAIRGTQLEDGTMGPPPLRTLEKIWGINDVTLSLIHI